MALKARKRNKLTLDHANLNITALMDILTVLLFFLVKSFTSSSLSTQPPDDVHLPTAKIKGEAEESVVVSLSGRELRANGILVAQLSQGQFANRDIASDQRTIVPLQIYLREEAKKRMGVFGKETGTFFSQGKLLIQADQNLPFGILKHLFHTATVSGYADYQFVVISTHPSQ